MTIQYTCATLDDVPFEQSMQVVFNTARDTLAHLDDLLRTYRQQAASVRGQGFGVVAMRLGVAHTEAQFDRAASVLHEQADSAGLTVLLIGRIRTDLVVAALIAKTPAVAAFDGAWATLCSRLRTATPSAPAFGTAALSPSLADATALIAQAERAVGRSS